MCLISLLKPKISLETPSADLFSLRSQILASHNNVCSSSHLQSHINAELVRSSRREKVKLLMSNCLYLLKFLKKSKYITNIIIPTKERIGYEKYGI